MNADQMIYKIDNFQLDNQNLLIGETIFHNANGYIGIRSSFEEGYPVQYATIRGQYMNAFYDIVEMNQAEKLFGLMDEKQTMLNIADTQSVFLYIDEELFSMFEGTVIESSRYLDMEKGYTARRIIWKSPKGKEAEILIKRMTSFSQLSLFLIDYQVTPLNFNGLITFYSEHKGEVCNFSDRNDPRVADGSVRYLHSERPRVKDDISYITATTSRSGLAVCSAVTHRINKEFKSEIAVKGKKTQFCLSVNAVKGETVQLLKYSVFCDSVRNIDFRNYAKNQMNLALSSSVEDIYRQQEDYLKEYWNNSYLQIYGDTQLNLAVHYNLYQLLQSVGKDSQSNIAAKGLSGEGYEGHFFWDTEMYILPYFILTQPDIAKKLISYRYTILESAIENAKLLGHRKGALYPWRTISGKECSGYFPSGTAQYHISGDIAYSVIEYYLATKDLEFIINMGAEIVFETARLWMDTGTFYKGKFCIHEVTGPDEYTCMVNNNYYTNALAKYNLEWAVKLYEILKRNEAIQTIKDRISLEEEEIKEFSEAAECMFLPYDEELGINPQDDSFLSKKIWDINNTPETNFPLLLHYHPLCLYRYQVCKQADTVLAHFILEGYQSMDTIRKSFDYYEKITTHDSSLSTCIFSIVASRLGLKEKAFQYFGESAKLDLFNLNRNTRDGIHTANMGGNYMAIVYGFGGLRINESGISVAPSLPVDWDGYEFCINYEGTRIKVKVGKEQCSLIKEEGNNIMIQIYGEKTVLSNNIIVKSLISK